MLGMLDAVFPVPLVVVADAEWGPTLVSEGWIGDWGGIVAEEGKDAAEGTC